MDQTSPNTPLGDPHRSEVSPSGMRLPLAVRVFLLVGLANALVFGAVLFLLAAKLDSERVSLTREVNEVLLVNILPRIDSRGDLDVAELFRWPGWGEFQDVFLVRWDPASGADPEAGVRGLFLNPIGSSQRAPDFDTKAALRLVEEAVERGEAIVSGRNWTIPIVNDLGQVWGGCWVDAGPRERRIEVMHRFLPRDSSARARLNELFGTRSQLMRQFLPGFLVSTLVLTLTILWGLRRFVLDPVAELARGARRVSAGDFTVRLPEPERRDEVSDLVRAFNGMTSQVENFGRTLEQEVEAATLKARAAENAAMTQRRLAAMGELAAGIAHEINNPLGGLVNAVESLHREDLPDERRRRYLGLLADGLERIRGTVAQLLRFTPRSTAPTAVSLVGPVRDAIDLISHRAERESVVIELVALEPQAGEPQHTLDDLPRIQGESHELGQAVLNLLVNALDAIAEAGVGQRIELGLGQRGQEVVLVVRDDGPGVSPEHLDSILDLFFSTKDVGKGSGLGLALVQRVVDDHGGRIQLENGAEGGLVVTLRFPIGAPGEPGGGAA